MRELFAARADNRLDELPVCVLVGAFHQLAQLLGAVGGLIVRTRDVEGTDRVVAWLNDVDRVEPRRERLEGIAQGRRLGRAVELAEPSSYVEARCPQPMGRGCRRHRGHDNRLGCACLGRLLEQALHRAGTIAQAMRLAAPETVGGERHQLRIAQHGRRDRGANQIDHVIAGRSGQVEHLRSSIPARTVGQKGLPVWFGQQRRHDVPPRVEIGGDEDQFAKAGLPEVLDQYFRVAPAERGSRGPGDRCRPANQVPHRGGESLARGLGIGARLVAECERFARDAGYQRIKLWTQSMLTAARAIYAKAGYQLVSSEPHHSFGADLVGEMWEMAL